MLKSINNLIFGPSPEESVKSWQNNIRKQGRLLDREIKQLDVSINKAKANLKSLVKVNDKKSLRILTKEIIKTDKQKIRLINSKSQLNSINMQLSHQLLTLKFTGSLKKSNEIMKLSSSLINLPQLSSTMSQMSQEMMKAGIMDEMLEDTMEMNNDEQDIEDEADEEIDKVLVELTGNKLSNVGSVTNSPLPNLDTEQQKHPANTENDEQLEQMQRQLDGLLRG